MVITYKQLHIYTEIIANLLQDKNIKTIVAIPNEGLIPAQLIALKLDIMDIRIYNFENPNIPDNAAIVKAFVETGATFKSIEEKIGKDKAVFCAPFILASSQFTNGVFGKWLTKKEGVELPWVFRGYRKRYV